MATHDSSINYENLIRDLAEMYPFDVPEVIIVELVANALDAGATRISIEYDPHDQTLIIEDNGQGMSASQFDEYHDFAAGLKARGTGIGFAGIGAKISFSIADRVITETRSDAFSGGSDWRLYSKNRLVWDDIQPVHLQDHGTRVEVRLRPDARLPYATAQDLAELLRRHYLPLTDSSFLSLYQGMGLYSADLRFIVNGEVIEPGRVTSDFGLSRVDEFHTRRGRKLLGYGVFGVAAQEYPIGPDAVGVMLCTHGKVIKIDLFNQFPASLGPRLFGVVEVPDLVKFLTTSKTDFNRRGKYREFERLYGPIRERFKAWLRDTGMEPIVLMGTAEARKLEREIRRMVEDVPELGAFFGFRVRKKSSARSTGDPVRVQDGALSPKSLGGMQEASPVEQVSGEKVLGPLDSHERTGLAQIGEQEEVVPAGQRGGTVRRVPKIAFAEVPDRVDLAWIEGNTVVLNTGHPSYTRAHSNAMARRLQSMLSIGSAIQRFLGSDSGIPDMMFVDRVMEAWGKR